MTKRVTDPEADEAEEEALDDGVQDVYVTSNGLVDLPSGATFQLQAGTSLSLTNEDADFLVANGFASTV